MSRDRLRNRLLMQQSTAPPQPIAVSPKHVAMVNTATQLVAHTTVNDNDHIQINDNDNININITNVIVEDKEVPDAETPPEEDKSEPENVAEEYTDRLYDDLKRILGDEELTVLNFASICVNLMQIVERFPNLSGSEKKKLVLRVFERYIEENHPADIALSMVPGFIDMLVAEDRGEVEIHIKPARCLAGCLACLSAVNSKPRRKKR